MVDILWNVVSFIVALGILVFIHEYGHFWVARKNNVKVLRFAVGFGKPIYSWYGRTGTEYVIGTIPLGGYVKMLDSRVEEVSEPDLKYAFDKKHVLRRIAIVSAGPLANFIFAVFLIFVMLLIGVPAVKPVIGDVEINSPAANAGLQKQDLILAINNSEVTDWQDANYKFIEVLGEPEFSITILRFAQNANQNINQGYDQQKSARLTKTMVSQDWQVEEGELLSGLGIAPYTPKPTLVVNYVDENGPAGKFGIQIGDKLVSVNGMLLQSWQQTVDLISDSANKNLDFSVLRDKSIVNLQIKPENRPTEEGFERGYLGVAPKFEEWPKDYVFINQYAILPAISQSFTKTLDLIGLTFNMIGKFVTGAIGLDNLSGPIAIAQGAGISAQSGLVYFISFMALISVNLGVVNLLPLPVLDGGHLMYFFIELIRGKPVSERVQEMGFRIGAFALMLIMGIALFNDFGRL